MDEIVNTSDEEPLFEDLFLVKKEREYTVSVPKRTYELLTKVAEETGKSRPKVLASFVDNAFYNYMREAQKNKTALKRIQKNRNKKSKKKRE